MYAQRNDCAVTCDEDNNANEPHINARVIKSNRCERIIIVQQHYSVKTVRGNGRLLGARLSAIRVPYLPTHDDNPTAAFRIVNTIQIYMGR